VGFGDAINTITSNAINDAIALLGDLHSAIGLFVLLGVVAIVLGWLLMMRKT
jgi:hypothetical protein